MAWTDVLTYAGPHWEVHNLTANLAADTTYVVNHSLGEIPIVRFFCSNNAAAAASEIFVSNPTDVTVQVNKKAGVGAGGNFCLHLSTLSHPH